MATLLYVDDEEVIGLVVSRFFAMRGDVVQVARDLASARAAIEREAPAIIFLDVWLGPESGVDLMQWILNEHPGLAERVTFVTGEAAGSPQKWSSFGRPVIRKPFDLTALAQVVDDAARRDGT